MVDRQDVVGWSLVGVLAGVLGGFVLSRSTGPLVKSTAKTYQLEDQREVIRNYLDLERDTIFVETSPDSDNYQLLSDYLATIENEYDRTIEEAKIRKVVSW